MHFIRRIDAQSHPLSFIANCESACHGFANGGAPRPVLKPRFNPAHPTPINATRGSKLWVFALKMGFRRRLSNPSIHQRQRDSRRRGDGQAGGDHQGHLHQVGVRRPRPLGHLAGDYPQKGPSLLVSLGACLTAFLWGHFHPYHQEKPGMEMAST